MALKTALITGSHTDVSQALCLALAKDKHDLVMISPRNIEAVEDFAEALRHQYRIETIVIEADLLDSSSAQRIYDHLHELNVPVDVLIHNDETGVYGEFTHTDDQRDFETLQLNIVAVTLLTKLFARDMVRRGLGKILMMSSVNGLFPSPQMATYSASKAYILSFSQTLRRELKHAGISVTVCCAGMSWSNFLKPTSASDVANTAYRGMQSRKRIVIPGMVNKTLTLLMQSVPKNLISVLLMKLRKRRLKTDF